MPELHSMIALFESQDEVLDACMGLAQDHLSDDDMAILAEAGAIMCRDGLARRDG